MEEDLGEEALAFVRKKVHHIDEDELDAGPEVLCYGKRALFIWQTRPVSSGKRALFIWQKSPVYLAKAPCLSSVHIHTNQNIFTHDEFFIPLFFVSSARGGGRSDCACE